MKQNFGIFAVLFIFGSTSAQDTHFGIPPGLAPEYLEVTEGELLSFADLLFLEFLAISTAAAQDEAKSLVIRNYGFANDDADFFIDFAQDATRQVIDLEREVAQETCKLLSSLESRESIVERVVLRDTRVEQLRNQIVSNMRERLSDEHEAQVADRISRLRPSVRRTEMNYTHLLSDARVDAHTYMEEFCRTSDLIN